MKLVSISVEKYRSIMKAPKVPISNLTVLVGPNNEGKSNLLSALITAMQLINGYAQARPRAATLPRQRRRAAYDWETDFPISLQEKYPEGNSVFKVGFELNRDEINSFRSEVGSNLNGLLPIEIAIGPSHKPEFRVLKRGPGGTALTNKASEVAEFIGKRIEISYIPAIRPTAAAADVVNRMVSRRLLRLENNPEYQEAQSKISEFQQPLLDELSSEVAETLKQFLPDVASVHITLPREDARYFPRRDVQIVVDDGTPTLLERKGDGVKSLAAISLLHGTFNSSGASILALEEPESHLHPSAINRLREIIIELSSHTQVVVTTHNPLLADRERVEHNILVQGSEARPASDISEIREILGVRASDNLIHARVVLLVEGESDRTILESLLKVLSDHVKSAMKNRTLVIECMRGVRNLQHRLSSLQTALCSIHVFFDADRQATDAFDNACSAGLLNRRDANFATIPGLKMSELEDCLDVNVYEEALKNGYGIDIPDSFFKARNKWSDRMQQQFKSQGRMWTDAVKLEVKHTVANAVAKKPKHALNEHRASCITTLVSELEKKLFDGA